MAKKMTKAETAIYFFEKVAGYRRVETGSRRYIAFEGPQGKFFVGKNGAVRKGRNISESMSVGDILWPRIEKETKKHISKMERG